MQSWALQLQPRVFAWWNVIMLCNSVRAVFVGVLFQWSGGRKKDCEDVVWVACISGWLKSWRWNDRFLRRTTPCAWATHRVTRDKVTVHVSKMCREIVKNWTWRARGVSVNTPRRFSGSFSREPKWPDYKQIHELSDQIEVCQSQPASSCPCILIFPVRGRRRSGLTHQVFFCGSVG